MAKATIAVATLAEQAIVNATAGGVGPEAAAAQLADYEAGTLALTGQQVAALKAMVKSVTGNMVWELSRDFARLTGQITFGDPAVIPKSKNGKRYLATGIEGTKFDIPSGPFAGRWRCSAHNGGIYVIER